MKNQKRNESKTIDDTHHCLYVLERHTHMQKGKKRQPTTATTTTTESYDHMECSEYKKWCIEKYHNFFEL
jgi:hypothetical protein